VANEGACGVDGGLIGHHVTVALRRGPHRYSAGGGS
jgi:hypothetical protein